MQGAGGISHTTFPAPVEDDLRLTLGEVVEGLADETQREDVRTELGRLGYDREGVRGDWMGRRIGGESVVTENE